MDKPVLVCDTSPLLYLGRVDHVHLVPALFEPVYVPEAVLLELNTGRLLRPDTIDPRTLDWATEVTATQLEIDNLPPNRLGLGERAVIAYAYAHPGYTVALDDRQARLLVAQLGLSVIGTVGILVKAKHAGLIPSIRMLLEAVQDQGFRLSTDLYNEALRLANEQQ